MAMVTNFGPSWLRNLHSAQFYSETLKQTGISQCIAKRIDGVEDPSTSCTNLVNLGPITRDYTTLDIVTLGEMQKKIGIFRQMS